MRHRSQMLACAAIIAGIAQPRLAYPAPEKVSICNMSDDELAERDRHVSRQERRQMERKRRKGRAA